MLLLCSKLLSGPHLSEGKSQSPYSDHGPCATLHRSSDLTPCQPPVLAHAHLRAFALAALCSLPLNLSSCLCSKVTFSVRPFLITLFKCVLLRPSIPAFYPFPLFFSTALLPFKNPMLFTHLFYVLSVFPSLEWKLFKGRAF